MTSTSPLSKEVAPTAVELLQLADQQAYMRARYNEEDSGLIRESRVIEWALRQAATPAVGEVKPYTWAYQYHDCIRFNQGQEVNGSRPTGTIALYDQATIDRLLAALQSVEPPAGEGVGPFAWRVCDERYPFLLGQVTERQTTVDAWRESDIKFQALYALPPVSGDGRPPSREAVARIIDPMAFKTVAGSEAHTRALHKADTILALSGTTAERGAGRASIIQECADVVGEMRQSEAGIFDAKHSGQRGEDRSNALYDAYQAIRSLKVSHP